MFHEFDQQFFNPRFQSTLFRDPFHDSIFQQRLTDNLGNKTDPNTASSGVAAGSEAFEKNTNLTSSDKTQTNEQELSTTSGNDQRMQQSHPRSWLSSFSSSAPICKLDVVEEKSQYLVHAELPGIAKENIKLDIKNNILTLSAETKHEINEEDKNKKYVRKERSFGSVTRSLQLPADVDMNKIEAKHENGMLNITLPRMELKHQQRQNTITIQ
jgi:HSP20 family protein